MKNLTGTTLLVLLIPIYGFITDRPRTAASEIPIEISIHPTIDLFSLISHLAGINQYSEYLLPEYNAEVDSIFGNFKNHSSIGFARECNIRHGINGDAPMALALYVGPPPALEPRMDLSNLSAVLDPRWDSALIKDYLENARVFAVESNFMEFYSGQKEFQDLARANLKQMIDEEEIFSWYYDFFGYYPESFRIYLALQNGSCNYGYPVTSPDGVVEFVSLLGARFPDSEGVPTYPKEWFLPVLIHEFTHSYINPLILNNPEEFRELGEALLVTHRAKMVEQGYNIWNVILQEYIARACTVRYMEQNESRRKARKQMDYEYARGFPEIQGLVRLLDDYENNRETYPDINAFLPVIHEYFRACLNEERH